MSKLSLVYSRAQDEQQRKVFHAAFKDWLCQASDEDYQQLEQARDLFAPNQVCSVFKMARGCMTRTDLAGQLPASLRQLLQERNWPQAGAGVTAL